MCGEKRCSPAKVSGGEGSPPRVRGKAITLDTEDMRTGITPACAGKSNPKLIFLPDLWDHPRVCGEKLRTGERKGREGDHPRVCGEKRPSGQEAGLPSGSPPRVRGKAAPAGAFGWPEGITPACAGKRGGPRSGQGPPRDHPRVCGEKPHIGQRRFLQKGSPPRVRGKAPHRARSSR